MTDTDAFAEKTDEDLAALTLRDREVFAYLMNRYEAKLLRYINRLANVRREEAEDILQESFIKMYQNLNAFDPRLKFSSWAYRITHNQVISSFRKNQARPQTAAFDKPLLETLAADIDNARDMDRRILHQHLKKALNRLAPKYREVLILKYFEEKDYREISDIIQKPMGTVATLLNRAKKLLTKELHKDKKFFL